MRSLRFGFCFLVLIVAMNSSVFAASRGPSCRFSRADSGIEDCDRVINSGRLKGKELGKAYRVRADMWSVVRERHDRAIVDYDRAIDLNPTDDAAYNGRGIALADGFGKYEEALKDYDQAIRFNAGEANYFRNRSIAHDHLKLYDRALSDITEAIRLKPKDYKLFEGRGQIRLSRNELDLALSDFEQALRLSPSAAFSHLLKARTLVRQGNSSAGERALDDMVRNYPDSALSYLTRAEFFSDQGKFYKAIDDYSRAIQIDRTATSLNSRGAAWLNSGEFDRAMRDFDEAIELDKSYSQPHSNRGRVWFERGKFDQAIAEFEAALVSAPRDVFSLTHRAKAFRAKGELELAMHEIGKALEIEPKAHWVRCERGNIQVDLGNLEAGISDYSLSIDAKDDNIHCLFARGIALEKMGKIAQAIEDYNHVAQLTPVTIFDRRTQDAGKQRGQALAAQVAKSTEPSNVSPLPPTAAAPSGRRVALVLGNSAYRHSSVLVNPGRDAIEVAAVLRRIGFQSVITQTDLSRDQLVNSLRDFSKLAETAEWALVYYSGHGMELGGVNYIIPVDAKLSTDRDVGYEAVALDQVLNAVDGAKKLRLVVLDACRDNPFLSQMRRTATVASRSVGRGFARVEPDAGTLVVFAAKHGETASDGEGTNSPFTTAFVRQVQKPGLEVRRLFDVVRDDVMETTRRKQQPFSYGSISGSQDFYFVPAK